MITYEERQARGTELCRRLTGDVARLCPPGMGTWEEAWAMAAPASSRFMLALARWETEATDVARDEVRHAYDDVVDAWRAAVARWLDVRAPGTEVSR